MSMLKTLKGKDIAMKFHFVLLLIGSRIMRGRKAAAVRSSALLHQVSRLKREFYGRED
jgi:hypothetical protein